MPTGHLLSDRFYRPSGSTLSHVPSDPLDDLAFRGAVGDVLAVLAYGEISAFSRLATDADLAPTLAGREQLARLAMTAFGNYDLLAGRLRELGVDPEDAVAPYVASFAAYHERTRPSNWLEGIVKAYVGDGIATDFFREIAAYVDPTSRAVILRALDDQVRSDQLLDIARVALIADPVVSGRLALWGRRLMGEALSQAQRVAAERASLASLLSGRFGGPGFDLAQLGEMFQRLAERHTDRMARLGLSA